MVKRFDAERPVESFKALLADLLKGYTFDVVGLHREVPGPTKLTMLSRSAGRCRAQ